MDSTSRADVFSQTVTDDDHHQSPEESGWTAYFQDFTENNHRDVERAASSPPSSGDCCCGYGASSFLVISDAASSAGKKADVGLPLEKTCRKLSFKKRRTGGAALVDDALEDTASSPVTSPKVYGLRLDMNPGEKAAHISKEKGRSYREEANGRGNGVGFIGRDSDICTDELKKRGLCLVPLSMIVDYLG